jgi:hypothetical protein
MFTVSESHVVVETRSALIQALRGRFKEEYVLRLLNKTELQEEARHISTEKSIPLYSAWYELLTRRAKG